jgi:hypothetical protein
MAGRFGNCASVGVGRTSGSLQHRPRRRHKGFVIGQLGRRV